MRLLATEIDDIVQSVRFSPSPAPAKPSAAQNSQSANDATGTEQ
jgi:hypothetical protein